MFIVVKQRGISELKYAFIISYYHTNSVNLSINTHTASRSPYYIDYLFNFNITPAPAYAPPEALRYQLPYSLCSQFAVHPSDAIKLSSRRPDLHKFSTFLHATVHGAFERDDGGDQNTMSSALFILYLILLSEKDWRQTNCCRIKSNFNESRFQLENLLPLSLLKSLLKSLVSATLNPVRCN